MALRGQRRYININDVKSGMMVQFTYSKKSGGTEEYVVLVIDPTRKNDHATEPQLHGFTIKELSDNELIDFFNSLGSNKTITADDKRAPVVESLNSDDAYAKFASSKYVSGRAYRTFNLSGISDVRQVLLGTVESKPTTRRTRKK
jgi:hypothetical protein